jgi:hypothetical protein
MRKAPEPRLFLLPAPANPRIPYGNEAAADEPWHPGGYDSGDVKEMVIDQIPNVPDGPVSIEDAIN